MIDIINKKTNELTILERQRIVQYYKKTKLNQYIVQHIDLSTWDDITKLCLLKNNSITINNHIIPASHYKEWTPKKNRNSKISLVNIDGNKKEVVLDKFMCCDYIFTQNLEEGLVNQIHHNKKINTEDIAELKSINIKIRDKYIEDFYLYQTKKDNQGIYEADLKVKENIDPRHKISIERYFTQLCEETYNKKIYLSYFKARNEFSLVKKSSQHSYLITVKILKIMLKKHKKLKREINYILTKLICMILFLNYIKANKKASPVYYWNFYPKYEDFIYKCYSKEIISILKSENTKILIIERLSECLLKTKNTNSYISTFINSYIINSQQNNYMHKDNNNSCLIIYNADINFKLKTRESPYVQTFLCNNDVKEIIKAANIPTPNKKLKTEISFLAYSPNILIISSNSIISDCLFNNYKNDPLSLFKFYNYLLIEDSKNLKLYFSS